MIWPSYRAFYIKDYKPTIRIRTQVDTTVFDVYRVERFYVRKLNSYKVAILIWHCIM